MQPSLPRYLVYVHRHHVPAPETGDIKCHQPPSRINISGATTTHGVVPTGYRFRADANLIMYFGDPGPRSHRRMSCRDKTSGLLGFPLYR